MSPPPSTKIPFRDIKDHADLMEAFSCLITAKIQSSIYGWNNDDDIRYYKSEIAHFLRIQSAQPGVAFDDSLPMTEYHTMTASELINKLEQSIKAVGDKPVIWCDDQECHDYVGSVTADAHAIILR